MIFELLKRKLKEKKYIFYIQKTNKSQIDEEKATIICGILILINLQISLRKAMIITDHSSW